MSLTSFQPACKEYCKGLSAKGRAAHEKRKAEAAAKDPQADDAPTPGVPGTQSSAGVPVTQSHAGAPTIQNADAVPTSESTAGVPGTKSESGVPQTKSKSGVPSTKSGGDIAGAEPVDAGSQRSGAGGAAPQVGTASQIMGSPSKASKGAAATRKPGTQGQTSNPDSITSSIYSMEGEEDFDLNTFFTDLLKHPYSKKILAAAILFAVGVKVAKELNFLNVPLKTYDPLKSGTLGKML